VNESVVCFITDGTPSKVSSGIIRTCKIRDLTVDTKYPIIRAERAMTHLGHNVLQTVLDGPNEVIKLFLPKR